MKTATIVFLLLLVVACPSFAQVGISLGTEYGFGLAAQLGNRNVKIELGGGLVPVLVYWRIIGYGPYGSIDESYLKFYLPGEVGAKLNISFSDTDENRLGFKLGASYNRIMKIGFGAGIDYRTGKKAPYLTVAGGFMYFPRAYDELLRRLNDEEQTIYNRDDVSAVLVGFRPYVGLTIYFGG